MSEIIKKSDAGFFRELCHKYKIMVFFLFGSHASRKTNVLSDVDIAYFPEESLTQKMETRLFLEVARRFKRDDIDLVDLSKAGLLLKYSVIRLGKEIACIDSKFLYNFIIRTRRDYLDTSYIRAIYAHYLAKRISLGQFGEVQ